MKEKLGLCALFILAILCSCYACWSALTAITITPGMRLVCGTIGGITAIVIFISLFRVISERQLKKVKSENTMISVGTLFRTYRVSETIKKEAMLFDEPLDYEITTVRKSIVQLLENCTAEIELTPETAAVFVPFSKIKTR